MTKMVEITELTDLFDDDGSARDGTDDAMRETKMWYDWDTSDDICTM